MKRRVSIFAAVIAVAIAGTGVGLALASQPSVIGGQSVSSVWPIGHDTLWVETGNASSLKDGGQGIELTSDGGRNWFNATPVGLAREGGAHWITALFALSSTQAWIVVGGVGAGPQSIEATRNAGHSWSTVGRLPSQNCTLQFVTAVNGTCTIYAGAAGSMAIVIYRTADGGATWRKIYDDTAVALSGDSSTPVGDLPFGCDKTLDFTSAASGWALFYCAGAGAPIFHTDDGGRTWTARTVGQAKPAVYDGAGFTGPVALDGQRGAVAFTGGNYSLVYATKDGGRSFQPVYPPRPRQSWTVDIVTPTRWRLVYRDGILATNDAGESWFSITSDAYTPVMLQPYAPSSPTLVKFTSARRGWLTWNTGNGYLVMRTSDGGYRWTKVQVPGTQPL